MFSNANQFFIGADKILQQFTDLAVAQVKNSYPPYNVKKLDDNKYQLEFAVAGFGKQDLEVELAGNKLIVAGKVSEDKSDPSSYLHKGISSRAFTREFTLSDKIEVNNAELLNGILKIWLDFITPEVKKPTKVEIKGE